MNGEQGRRDALVLSLVGLAAGLGAGALAVVVRRFFATELVARLVAALGLASAAFGVFALARAFARGERERWRARAIPALVFATLALFLSVVVCDWLQAQTLKSLADRSQRLVDALYAYRREHQAFPERLEQLVPELLPALPRTSMRGDPPYEYARDPQGGFELWVDLRGTGEGERLFYRSAGDYPPQVEVLRAWGFEE